MPEQTSKHKRSFASQQVAGRTGRRAPFALQLAFVFAYGHDPARAAAPMENGRSYQQALVRRVRTAFNAAFAAALGAAEIYAVSLAARTDCGVAARQNFATLRLRWPHAGAPQADGAAAGPWPTPVAIAAALEAVGACRAPEDPRPSTAPGPDRPVHAAASDGLRLVVGWQLGRRAMARAQAGEKTYVYRLEQRPPQPTPAATAAAHALVAAFATAQSFQRFCEAKAGRAAKARGPRPPCRVRLHAPARGTWTLEVTSRALLRHQVRHMAAAVLHVLAEPGALAAVAAALGSEAAPGYPLHAPAQAGFLCLERVALGPELRGA